MKRFISGQISPRVFSAALLVSLVALLLAAGVCHAQTFAVLHTFTGGGDGGKPNNGLTLDQAGSLYGTTPTGGLPGGCDGAGCGVVFRLTRRNSAWVLNPLYAFTGGSDGAMPWARVTIGPDGTLYGTAILGGSDSFPNGTGVVFNLRPPSRISSRVFTPWNERVLYTFFGNMSDGNYPSGDLTFDAAGNLYGTTQEGGYECEDVTWCGVVYELVRNGSGWMRIFVYQFNSGNVAFPNSGVIFDQAGNLYGTTSNGGGAAFQLVHSGIWTLNEIQGFGDYPTGLVIDAADNLYGGTSGGGTGGTGTVYKLTHTGGDWSESVIYNLPGSGNGGGITNSLAWDASGNLYGATCLGGSHNSGSVFKLTPSGGDWIPTTLYEFTGGNDGFCPYGSLVVDGSGNVFGTTDAGGANQQGVIFEITP